MPRFAAPKGVPEYYPPASRAFVAVKQALVGAAVRAGYGPIELAMFEDTEVFRRGVGESTDVVSKEMYTFADRAGRSLTLRPEGTAPVIRSILENGLDRGTLPVKLVYEGEFFRAERPQAGRYRQFQQVGVEAVGTDDPALDAEVIAVAHEGYRALGLSGYHLDLTSLGDATCRPAYRALLQEFLAGLDLDDATRERARANPLRVLDDKRPGVVAQLADAPLIADHLCAQCVDHFASVRTVLDALEVPYTLNPRMVRGLDYYTRTTFEFVHPLLGAQSGLGGGGRYDGLMAELGGRPLSGIGFGLGVDRALLAVQAEGLTAGSPAACEVYGIALGGGEVVGTGGAVDTGSSVGSAGDGASAASTELAVLAGHLRLAGVAVDRSYGRRGLKAAMKSADASGARLALIVGENEMAAGMITVRDLVTGDQRPVPRAELVAVVRELLA